ncbi:MAG: arginine--tRNA ligase [Candidatus Caldarchaeum sp.]
MKKLVEEVEQLLRHAGVGDPKISLSKEARFGDVSSSASFDIAKTQGRKPVEIARELAAKISTMPMHYVKYVEVAEPGYLNFFANWNVLAVEVLTHAINEKSRFGEVDLGRGVYVLVEHSSVNPNKALHIGHARNVCLGDSLARLLAKTGYKVAVANYVDDSGVQMAEILLAFTRLGYSFTQPPDMKFDEYCGKIYAQVSRHIESNPELEAARRKIAAELENPESETYRLNREIVDRVLLEQLATCWRIGARYDVLNKESDVIFFDLWTEVFQRLKELKAIYLAESGPKKGCWLIDLSEHPKLSKEGNEVFVKSDGSTTYVARDVGYAAWKIGLLDKDFSYRLLGKNPDGTDVYITDRKGTIFKQFGSAAFTINVVDVRQKRPQEVVRYALQKLGADPSRYIHYAYEVVSLSKADAQRLNVQVEEASFVHMSGRGGIYVNVDPLLDHIKSIAAEGTRQRHPDWSREKTEMVGEKIAVAALRYFLLRSDPDKMIIFDSAEASDIEGDTGPYIQYAYARATRILEKSDSHPNPTMVPEKIEPEEIELIKKIGILPMVFEEAVKNLSVKRVVSYLRELAVAFNDFYEKCPVLTANPDAKAFRLALVESFRSALSSAASVVGIPLLEEM